MIDLAKTFETVITAGGLLIGVMYVIGGLIVNLHLARFGVTEYQILRVKYLVVGLTYLTNFIAVLLLATLPAILVAAANIYIQQGFLISSLLASTGMLWLWGKSKSNKSTGFLFTWRFWVITGAIAAIYPIAAIVRSIITTQLTLDNFMLITQAFLASILAFVGQTYFYARHLYGRSNSIFGSVDPIGMGIPVDVQLAIKQEAIPSLAALQMPKLGEHLIGKVQLLDETDAHYIIGVSYDDKVRAAKITKEIVQAIMYS